MIRMFNGDGEVKYSLTLNNEGQDMNFNIMVPKTIAVVRAKDIAKRVQEALPEATISVLIADENAKDIMDVFADGHVINID